MCLGCRWDCGISCITSSWGRLRRTQPTGRGSSAGLREAHPSDQLQSAPSGESFFTEAAEGDPTLRQKDWQTSPSRDVTLLERGRLRMSNGPPKEQALARGESLR